MSGASERANGRASGPVLQSLFLTVIDHSVLENSRTHLKTRLLTPCHLICQIIEMHTKNKSLDFMDVLSYFKSTRGSTRTLIKELIATCLRFQDFEAGRAH